MPYFQDPQGVLHYLSDTDIANGGESLLPAGCEPITDAQALAIQNPVPTLAEAQSAQTAALYAACQSAITDGFQSTALGATYSYPSTITDQTNQNTVASTAAGGYLYCKNSTGAWALVKHTQAQAQAVVASFAAWLNACQQQLASFNAQVAIAATTAAVAAIAWVSPTL